MLWQWTIHLNAPIFAIFQARMAYRTNQERVDALTLQISVSDGVCARVGRPQHALPPGNVPALWCWHYPRQLTSISSSIHPCRTPTSWDPASSSTHPSDPLSGRCCCSPRPSRRVLHSNVWCTGYPSHLLPQSPWRPCVGISALAWARPHPLPTSRSMRRFQSGTMGLLGTGLSPPQHGRPHSSRGCVAVMTEHR